VYAVQTVDRRGSKLQIFGLPSRASSRDLSLSVIVGSLLAHCQNRLSAWIIGPPLDRVQEQLDDLSAFESNTCRREQDDTPGSRVLPNHLRTGTNRRPPDLRRTCRLLRRTTLPRASRRCVTSEAPADKDDHGVHRWRQHIPQLLVAVRQTCAARIEYDIAYSAHRRFGWVRRPAAKIILKR
jgi:hypothetical protein